MSNIRSRHRDFQRQYYGGYCNKCKENEVEPLAYTQFKDVLDDAMTLHEFKKDIMKYLLHKTMDGRIKMRVLECSSKGDKRYSAFYARVNVFGKYDSIENHYQLCKRFGEEIPLSWRDSKGKTPTHFNLKGRDIDVNLLGQFYSLLWVKYLDENLELVEYASGFDDFNDIFKGKSLNCQADVIRKYIKQGRKSILEDCKEFIDIMYELQKI